MGSNNQHKIMMLVVIFVANKQLISVSSYIAKLDQGDGLIARGFMWTRATRYEWG